MTEEKFARPGLYLDTDDHEKLLDENRGQYLQEKRDRLLRELQETDEALRAER